MKKTVFMLATVAAFVVSFCSCVEPTKSTADLLASPKNGWVLESATSSPAYLMGSGEYVTDLLNGGYLYDYEKDDVIAFTTTGGQTIAPGTLTDPEGYTETRTYVWALDQTDPTIIYMQVPFFYDDVQETCRILELSKNVFRFNCTMNDDDPAAKGTYTFTLQYVPAK